MDPISPIALITSALAFGATETSKGALGEVGKGIFQSLKSRILALINGDTSTELVLAEHEKDPETYAAPVRKKLEAHAVDKNEDVIRLARELMNTADPIGFDAGKYNVNMTNAQGVQFGSHNHIEITNN